MSSFAFFLTELFIIRDLSLPMQLLNIFALCNTMSKRTMT